MNKKEEYEAYAYVNRKVRRGTSNHRNCIRLSGNKHHHKHNVALINQALEYLYLGIPFYTEVEFAFPWKGRADIVLPLTQEIIEIVNTESKESIEEKKKKYPPWKLKVVKV